MIGFERIGGLFLRRNSKDETTYANTIRPKNRCSESLFYSLYRPLRDSVRIRSDRSGRRFFILLVLGHPFAKLNHKATGLLLKVSVVGLGFGMNVHSALQVGREGLELTVVSIALLLTLGYFVGRWLRMPRKSSHLVASGTAICGGSAIAAVAPPWTLRRRKFRCRSA